MTVRRWPEQSQSGRLAGKVALITGAGSGLGREVAMLFAHEGANVVVTDINEQRAKAVAAEIGETGDVARSFVVDVTSEDQVAAGMDQAVSWLGALDIVHANAGVGVPGGGSVRFEDTTEESWDTVNDVNVKGVFFTIKHAARVMKQSGGCIIATSSAASTVAYPGMAIYASGKAAVNGLVRNAAFDLGRYGIRVNAVCPVHGMSVNFALPADAEVLGKSYEEVSGPWGVDAGPMPLKIADPPSLRDNAYPVLFLASDEARYMSGVCMSTCDGGTMARTAVQFPEGWSLNERVEAMNVGSPATGG
jgi:NAD(P)-dependent dehydrogenase (short-subunit alcohol dehydrogenase family)